MKVSGAKQVHYDSGPNMTPLVDVVMVILIFLMLAGSFGTSEHFMASKTPIHLKGAASAEVPPNYVPPTMLDVIVSENGDYTLSGAVGPNGQLLRMRNPDELRTRLLARAPQYGKLDDVEIVLRPDTNTHWEALAPLYDAALRAKYQKVSFAMTGAK